MYIAFLESSLDDLGQYTVKFAPGVTRVFLDVQIIDQIIISDNKYYQLIINHSLLPDGVTTYHPDKASLVAVDNCKYIIISYQIWLAIYFGLNCIILKKQTYRKCT